MGLSPVSSDRMVFLFVRCFRLLGSVKGQEPCQQNKTGAQIGLLPTVRRRLLWRMGFFISHPVRFLGD